MNVTSNGNAPRQPPGPPAPPVRPRHLPAKVHCDLRYPAGNGGGNPEPVEGRPGSEVPHRPGISAQAAEVVRKQHPDVLILDKGFGIQAVLDWLAEIQTGDGTPLHTAMVVWGVSVTEAEALRFLQAGARGILRKSAGVQAVVACLRTVAAGRSWMEDCVFRDSSRSDRYPRSELTAREQQVLELVEQGFKNKEIAGGSGHPARHGQDPPEAHLRKNRRARPLRPGPQRLAGSRPGFPSGLSSRAHSSVQPMGSAKMTAGMAAPRKTRVAGFLRRRPAGLPLDCPKGGQRQGRLDHLPAGPRLRGRQTGGPQFHALPPDARRRDALHRPGPGRTAPGPRRRPQAFRTPRCAWTTPTWRTRASRSSRAMP